MTIIMQEIPFLQHHSPLPLPYSNSNRGGEDGGQQHHHNHHRQSFIPSSVIHVTSNAIDIDDDQDGAIRLTLTTSSTAKQDDAVRGDETNNSNEPLPLSNTTISKSATKISNNILSSDSPDYYFTPSSSSTSSLRGLTSTYHCPIDNRFIFTNGIVGKKKGLIRISIMDNDVDNNDNTSNNDNDDNICRIRDIDLSSLFETKRNNGVNLLDSSIVGVATFVVMNPSSSSSSQREGESDDDDDDGEGGKMTDDEGEDLIARPTQESILVLRAVDMYGSVLSLALSYPSLEPMMTITSPLANDDRCASFLIPLSPTTGVGRRSPRLLPHPGSTIEHNQVCFPTPTTVVFALNPHLYCVDFGGIGGKGRRSGGFDPNHHRMVGSGPGAERGLIQVKTRVWTNLHVVTSDPIADQLHLGATTTPILRKKKKPRKSLGGILAMATYTLMGIPTYDAEQEYEYPDDEVDDDDDDDRGNFDDGGRGTLHSAIPSIATLTSLTTVTTALTNNDDTIAKVATLHSDGSLRIWIAEPSRREKSVDEGGIKLRIPSVQRLAIVVDDDNSGPQYIDPPIPNPSLWDPSRDALVLRGKSIYDPRCETFEYECALYIQCYASKKKRREGRSEVVHVFRGGIVGVSTKSGGGDEDDSTRALPSGNTANVQTLALPAGATSVVDLSWAHNQALIVMLRHRSVGGDDVANSFYDIVEEEMDGSQVAMAMYPLEGSSFYSNEVALPPNMTISQFDLNHRGTAFACVAEELDRYMLPTTDFDTNDVNDIDLASTNHSLTELISNANARLDRAGLLAILQPFGRSRPSALAVYYAMSSLHLLDEGTGHAEIYPVTILSAMRKWKKPSSFKTLSTFVPGESETTTTAILPGASNSFSIYHAFASATNASNTRSNLIPDCTDVDDDDFENRAHDVEAAKQSHRMKWIRLLSEIRRYQAELDEVLCFKMSSSATFLFRGSMISAVTLDDRDITLDTSDAATTTQDEFEVMARLDELAIDLFVCITSNPELRNLLSTVESMLYDGVSKAASLVDGWADRSMGNNKLLSQVEMLGSYAMVNLALTDSQMQLLNEMSRLGSDFTENWLMSPTSKSSTICARLSISKDFNAPPSSLRGTWKLNAITSAADLIASRLESIRQLSLSRLFIVFGAPCKNPLTVQQGALRFTLYCTALSWSVHQPSSKDKKMTVLEDSLSTIVPKISSGILAASRLTDNFCFCAFGGDAHEALDRALTTLFPVWRETSVALRMLAPFVAFPSQFVSLEVKQKRMNATAECLLAEAATVAKLGENSGSGTTVLSLWQLASKILVDATTLKNRVETLERYLTSIELGDANPTPFCCGVILEAIKDALDAKSADGDVPALWDMAFQVAIRGHLWEKALHVSVAHPLVEQRRLNLKRLILGMVDKGALGKLVDMSLTVVRQVSSISTRIYDQENDNSELESDVIDLFELASEFIEEAAIEETSWRPWADAKSHDGHVVIDDRPNYWSCLYALHASRGNWRQAAHAMDMFGKATVHSVSTPKFNPQKPLVLSKAASRKVMDEVCLSSQACAHAIKIIDNPSHRYLLTGNDDIPSESRLLTERDLERRAARALALCMLSMDENSPDSVGSILESSSKDTIDTLARFGYYDQAISVSMGVSSKRGGLPGGVDLFDEALNHILCTYLIPSVTAMSKNNPADEDGSLESLQSRSKIAQIRASSSACALGSASGVRPLHTRVTCSTSNCMMWAPNQKIEHALQSSMALDLLHQFTIVHSERCPTLGLNVADAILSMPEGMSNLPTWLTELCIFGLPSDGNSDGGLFAQMARKRGGVSNPPGLMRVFIKHHQYGEACDVVSSILLKRVEETSSCASDTGVSSRLPEKGCIDYIPYDLIDMLWDMIESIIAAHSSCSCQETRSQVQSLIKKRNRMEKALEMFFETLKLSEEGLSSARRLTSTI